MTPSSFCDQLVLFYCLSSNGTCGGAFPEARATSSQIWPSGNKRWHLLFELGSDWLGPIILVASRVSWIFRQKKRFFLPWLLPQQLGRKPELE